MMMDVSKPPEYASTTFFTSAMINIPPKFPDWGALALLRILWGQVYHGSPENASVVFE
jgi:hypothetical protein